MILGIGTDIIEIDRIEKAIQKERFLKRYFTPSEILLYQEKGNKPQTIAGNFAAKEAIAKAMGTGFLSFSPIDIEILRDEKGAPFVNIYNKCKKTCESLGIHTIHISISHNKHHATAFAVLEST